MMKKTLLAALFASMLVVVGCSYQDPIALQYNDQVVIYSAPAVQTALANNQQVVLNFRASWCPNCNAFADELNQNNQQLDPSIVVVDVNYDEYADLKQQYNVTQQHTFVLLNADGTQRAKALSMKDVAELNNFVQQNSVDGNPMWIDDLDMQPLTGQNLTGDVNMQGDVSMQGGYGVYTDQQIQQALDNNLQVVYFFHASWCPTCVALDKNLVDQQDEITASPLLIVKVDYDTATQLKQKYEITMQHTLVLIDKEFNLITKRNGSQDLEDIQLQIQ